MKAHLETGDKISGSGTIEFIQIEGGFYGIVGDDGSHYRPQNLSQDFRSNGTRVFFEVTVLEQQDSIFMWGLAVNIDTLEKLMEIGDSGNITGTVRFIPEIDQYGIITDSGQKFVPADIPDEFRANGTYIQFEYTVRDVQADALWGTSVQISNIELAPQSCTSCNSYWWAYSTILVVLAAFIIFRMTRRSNGGEESDEAGGWTENNEENDTEHYE